ncbi:mitochondrial basic amino acids transporter isoform X2 [Parasteatoda tepidariorum]|nr:mitochondrial basic amino acids transporter isoform X2 [Parasteatoda tepidariorum]
MSSPMAGLAAVNAIVFGVYGNLVRASTSDNLLLNQFLAGSTAGVVQSLVTSPMELAKTRMQLQGQENRLVRTAYWTRNSVTYKNPVDCLVKAFKMEGTRGLYRGLWCTILRDAPGFGVYFSSYEYLTSKVTKGNTLSLLSVGGLAGVISWIVIYPFDVIKSRLQVDGMDGKPRKYNNLFDCVRKSYKEEGLQVFTRGLNSTIIRAFPTNAATFAVFTWVFMIFESPSAPKISVEQAKGVLMLEKEMQNYA